MNDLRTPATEPAPTHDDGKTEKTVKHRPKWLVPAIAAACALVLAAGGVGGYMAWNAHELGVAESACAEAADELRVAANEYAALVNGDAADMAAVKTADVKDAKTVTTLADALKTQTPEYSGCVADDKTGLDAATAKLGEQTTWYARHVKSLRSAVDAVSASKLGKTIDTANALLKSSDGKVQDNATRTALEKAVKARDAEAIATASKKVNDSIAAKTKADEEAKAKAEAEAKAAAEAAAAAAAAQAQSYTPTYSYGSTGGYSSGSYTPTYSGGSSGSSSSGSTETIAPPVSGGHGCGDQCAGNGDGIYHH
ncbi:hypothetical protein [Bifidobacterium aesculapii]|uniref:hypothetical protein n=1 Tax=Bifidobacterium aesculapii TaxID=1329411 RepID=UPI0006E1CB2E|nr:hypothetical protein [Bifidobacterium aesculapii]